MEALHYVISAAVVYFAWSALLDYLII